MKKILLFLLTATILVAKPLVVGIELAYPPFEMSDEKGEPTGISVDFIKEYAKWAKRDIEIKNIEWVGLIPALKSGKIDLIISSMTITDERKKVVDFSDPYAKSNLGILTPKNSDINSIQDLDKKGKKLAVKKGSTGHLYATKYMKNVEVLLFDKENTAILEVIQEKADGFFYDQLTLYKNQKKHPESLRAILTPFQEEPEYWGIAVRKGNDELRNSLNEFIKISKENGFFNELGDKYLKELKDVFKELNIEFFL